MEIATTKQHWSIGQSEDTLSTIHLDEINIVVWKRETEHLSQGVKELIEERINFKASGNFSSILEAVFSRLDNPCFDLIVQDIIKLLNVYKELTKAERFSLLLTVVESNMCTRFHSDANDLRLLCTYRRPGTLWLKEENIDRHALETYKDNSHIVLNPKDIQEAEKGSVVILKGSAYANGTKGAVHRSPAVEKPDDIRLLLRLDTN